jgi:hypothetical protein
MIKLANVFIFLLTYISTPNLDLLTYISNLDLLT